MSIAGRPPAGTPSRPGTGLSAPGDPGTTSLVAPAAVVELSLEHPPADILLGITRQGIVYRSALAVVRIGVRAVGTAVLRADHIGRVSAAQVAAALTPFGRANRALGPVATPVPMPRMTTVITTGGRADAAVRAVGALLRGNVIPDEVIVVDSAPRGDVVRRMLAEWYPGEAIRLIACPGAGRAASRNAGLALAAGDVVVFADDGVIADRDWLGCLMESLVVSGADCATGMALPLDIDLDAYLELERLTRSAKGYFRRSIHRGAQPGESPFATHPDSLTGARRCLAVWREVADRLGGFDPLLGAGTPARGGEDLDFVTRLLADGLTLVQEPAAIVWHERRADARGLRREAFGRGAGLSAAITKHLVEGPGRGDVLRGIPENLGDLLAPARAGRSRRGLGRLEVAQIAGVAFGPLGYARGRVRGRRRVVTPAR